MCGALAVSRGGFYVWLKRPPNNRTQEDEVLGTKIRTSFLASNRTYGARRVRRDVMEEGLLCALRPAPH
jgi:putative transposase